MSSVDSSLLKDYINIAKERYTLSLPFISTFFNLCVPFFKSLIPESINFFGFVMINNILDICGGVMENLPFEPVFYKLSIEHVYISMIQLKLNNAICRYYPDETDKMGAFQSDMEYLFGETGRVAVLFYRTFSTMAYARWLTFTDDEVDKYLKSLREGVDLNDVKERFEKNKKVIMLRKTMKEGTKEGVFLGYLIDEVLNDMSDNDLLFLYKKYKFMFTTQEEFVVELARMQAVLETNIYIDHQPCLKKRKLNNGIEFETSLAKKDYPNYFSKKRYDYYVSDDSEDDEKLEKPLRRKLNYFYKNELMELNGNLLKVTDQTSPVSNISSIDSPSGKEVLTEGATTEADSVDAGP